VRHYISADSGAQALLYTAYLGLTPGAMKVPSLAGLGFQIDVGFYGVL